MKKLFLLLLVTIQFFQAPSSCSAADVADAFQYFQEEAKVITASRRSQPLQEIPMAVDIITAEEIRASGATNLWDLLRFRAGMDVLDARATDGTRGIVSVRGFPQEFVHNLQVLLDGRSVYEPISNTVFWGQLPVDNEDIERIEIIRGPNAALYGSGAGLGVVNIITKKPIGSTKLDLHAFGGNRGMVSTHEAVESSFRKFSYRVSHTFQQEDGFPLSAGPNDGTDFLHSQKATGRLEWTPNEKSNFEFLTGASWQNNGLPSARATENDYSEHFEMLKFSQKVSASTIELLTSRRHYINESTPDLSGGTSQYDVLQYDEELLQRWQWWQNRLNTTYGVNYRNAAANSVQLFVGRPDQRLELWNGYFNQMIQLTRDWSITGGSSWESSNAGQGGLETNYQIASLWSPLENHAFRASYSVAHTVPDLFNTVGNNRFNPTVTFVGNPDLKPQKITSYEIGHRVEALNNHLQINNSLYYTVVKNIDTTFVQSAVFFPQPAITLGAANVNEAIARGVETEIRYRFDEKHSVYTNYTYERISDWIADEGEISRNTPAHKVNFGGIADFGAGLLGSMNVGFKDNYLITSVSRSVTVAIPAYWRLDARLAYVLPWYKNAQLFVAGQNLAQAKHREFADGLAIPRTYQGGLTVQFSPGK